MTSDQLKEVEMELYKHVGCKMFHLTGDTAHSLHCCVCSCVFLNAYVRQEVLMHTDVSMY